MSLSLQSRCLLLALFAALSATGCGSGNTIKIYPVKGRVNFAGKPMVGGGSIAFVPLANQPGKTAGGEIKEDGSYEMTTHESGDGSMTGEFRVVIQQTIFREPKNVGDGAGATPAATTTVAEGDRIPAVYSDAQNSPLKTTVEAKELNELNFDLQRAP